MSTYRIEDTTLTDIADQLRLELDTTQTYNPEDMPLAIHLAATQGGGGAQVETLETPTKTSDARYPLTPTLPINGTWTWAMFGFYATNPDDRGTTTWNNVRKNLTSDPGTAPTTSYGSLRFTALYAYKQDNSVFLMSNYSNGIWIGDIDTKTVSVGLYIHWGKNPVPVTGFCIHD